MIELIMIQLIIKNSLPQYMQNEGKKIMSFDCINRHEDDDVSFLENSIKPIDRNIFVDFFANLNAFFIKKTIHNYDGS